MFYRFSPHHHLQEGFSTFKTPAAKMHRPKLSRSLSVTTTLTSTLASTISQIHMTKSSSQVFPTDPTLSFTDTPLKPASRRHSVTPSPTSQGRPAYVRYRSRRNAQKRTRPGTCPYTPPCDIVEQALGSQTEIVRDVSQPIRNRLIPLVLTWYMEWVLELYSLLLGQSPRHSFWKWTVSCLTVTLLCMVVFATVAWLALQGIYYVSLVANGLIAFSLFLVFIVTCTVCCILILNYGVVRKD